MTRAADLPEFASPPVDEVAIGYLFPPVLNYSDSLVAAFWQTVRNDYPKTTLQPRVDAPLESLNPTEAPAAQTIVPAFAPNQGRTWLISSDEQFVVQIQNTRFFLNWRKRNQDYPRFDDIRPRFDSIYERYVSFMQSHGSQRPGLQQLEVTYINWIPQAMTADFFLPAIAAVLDVKNVAATPIDLAWASRYMVNGPMGNPWAALHVQCMPAMRLDPPERGTQLHLTFRAPFAEEPSEVLLDDLAEAGRDAIVRTFTALTTDRAHVEWGMK